MTVEATHRILSLWYGCPTRRRGGVGRVDFVYSLEIDTDVDGDLSVTMWTALAVSTPLGGEAAFLLYLRGADGDQYLPGLFHFGRVPCLLPRVAIE